MIKSFCIEKYKGDIMEEINGRYEYQLNYSKDKNGYSAFKIEKVFEATPF